MRRESLLGSHSLLHCFLFFHLQGLLKSWEAHQTVQHLAGAEWRDNMVRVWLWQQPRDRLIAASECRIVMANAHDSKAELPIWAALIILFPSGQKPICLVFNTTKFLPSSWQNGSGRCLKRCNENNFCSEPRGSRFRLEKCEGSKSLHSHGCKWAEESESKQTLILLLQSQRVMLLRGE